MTKTYSVSARIRAQMFSLALVLIFGTISSIYFGITQLSTNLTIGLFSISIGCLAAYNVYGMYKLSPKMKLILDPNGITYQSPFQTVFSTWHNLQSFIIKRQGYRKLVSLQLREPVPVTKAGKPTQQQTTFIRIHAFTPKNALDESFIKSQLANDLRQFAPHIFTEQPATPEPESN